MSTSTTKTKQKTERTPSMAASLLVLGVMIGLILLSVMLFGEEVAAGPLQVAMTLATIFALGMAYFYGFRGALISEAISKNINAALGTIFSAIIPWNVHCAFVAGALGMSVMTL